MQNKRLTLLVLTILVVVLIVWARGYFSPEQVVRRQLLSAVESFEQEQMLATVMVISRSYQDEWGQSYESVAGNISEIMSTFDDLRVELDDPEISRVEDDVRTRLRFVISGRDNDRTGYVMGSTAEPCTATVRWRNEPQGWRLITTEALDIPELRDELDAMKSNSSTG